jgi:serpin B
LLGHLAALGFDASGHTDFTGIGPDNPFLGSAVHAATVTVDEKGTVAAAATAAMMARGAPPTAEVAITADRPYLYLIRHTLTGTVLFAGRVVDPSA